MAIALDSVVNSGGWILSATSMSFSKTNTGSNLFLAVGSATYNSSLITVTGITYNSVALTLIDSQTASLEGAAQHGSFWYLDAPASGANTCVITLGGSASFAEYEAGSYTGKTTSGLDGHATAQNTSASTSSPTNNVTVVHSDCWLVGYAYSRAGESPAGGTGTTARSGSGVGHAFGDSNGVVGTGSQTLAFTVSLAATWPGVFSASISAANASGGGGTLRGPFFTGNLSGLGSGGLTFQDRLG